jgi:peptidoglycan/xylan/chitin deacetylase (PgdA/CDA1 family)
LNSLDTLQSTPALSLPRPAEGTVGDFLKCTSLAAYRHSGLMSLHAFLRRQTRPAYSTILLFHRVNDILRPDGLTVGVTRFREFCALMKQSYRVVPLAEIFRGLEAGEAPPPRTVTITFDDSYADNLPAAETLHEFGLPATFFVPTDYIDTDRVFPWDIGLPRLGNLTWADLRRMAALGHDIGSHTASHPNLSQLPHDQTRDELIRSKETLEDRLGRRVRHFAYPFGSRHHLRNDQLPLIYEAGYEGCVSAVHGFVEAGMRGQILPRAAVPNFRNLAHLEVHIHRCLDWIYDLKRRLGLSELPDDPT